MLRRTLTNEGDGSSALELLLWRRLDNLTPRVNGDRNDEA
jgi:hypothetical protein